VQRDPESHKGENGKVAIIGGSRHQHGAPLFCALAAEKSGVDLVYVSLPHCHEEVAKNTSLNFQVHAFAGEEIARSDIESILELLATMDSAVIGPGIWRNAKTISVLESIIASASCPLVLDASALQPFTLPALRGKPAILTPHRGELERMGLTEDALPTLADESGVTIILKGLCDRIFGPGEQTEISGGNAGLTVGGTGDALAGLLAGLVAQKLSPFEAALLACTTMKKAGEFLFEEQGFSYTARDVIKRIPFLLKGTNI